MEENKIGNVGEGPGVGNFEGIELDLQPNNNNNEVAEVQSPTNPIMGLYFEQDPPGSGKWNIRMGGKPNAEWTGLVEGQTFLSTPFHFRRPEMTSDSKGYLLRSTGLSNKFGMSDDVLQFEHHV